MNSINGAATYEQSSLLCHEELTLSPHSHDSSGRSESFLPPEESKARKRKFKMLTEQNSSDNSDKSLTIDAKKCSQEQLLPEKSHKTENKFLEITSRMETLSELYRQGFPSTSLKPLHPIDSSKDQKETDNQVSIPEAIETIVLESIARLEQSQAHEELLRNRLKELEEEQARLKEAVSSINSWLRGND